MLTSSRTETYQASGTIAIQLAMRVADAVMRIRAHAFVNDDQAVAETAARVVARRLRLPNDYHSEIEVSDV